MDQTVAAYIAGLIDGEGTLTLSRRHRNENRHLVVSVSNTDRPLPNTCWTGLVQVKSPTKESAKPITPRVTPTRSLIDRRLHC